MRPYPLLLAPLLILASLSCSTLNRLDIQSADRQQLEPLKLEPILEASELRIDLIRRSTNVQINDSTTESQDTPYHPVGFDLGNGLLYDLNGNLAFRLEELLGVPDGECYTAMQTSRRRQRRADRVFTNCDGLLTVRYPPGRREREVNHLDIDNNTISVYYRNRFQYAVEFNEESVVYRGRRQKWETIHRADDGHYFLRRGFWRDHYRLEGNRLLLNDNYIFELSDDRRQLKIIRPGLFSRTLYTLIRTDNQVFIYDRGYRGKRIEFTPEGLRVYHNRTFLTGWTLSGF